MQTHLTRLLSLLLLCLPTLLNASQGAITIEADRLEIDQPQGRSYYHGNVHLEQGQMLLRADKLEIRQQQGQLQRVIADGRPVRLQLPDEEGTAPIRAEAQRIDYHFDSARVELLGEAVLWRGGDEFRGQHLIYDIERRHVQAFGKTPDDGEDGRVRIILQPEGRP